jgi:hypothetical protein
MPTKQPIPPPDAQSRMEGCDYSLYALLSAISWRQLDKIGDPRADSHLNSLRSAIDMLDRNISLPKPTSPPPPRKKS